METCHGASLLILCLHLAWVSCLQKVEQNPQSLKIQDGGNTTINCTYTETINQGLQWFRQDPGKGLISLFYLTAEEKQKGRLRSTISRKDRQSSLHITGAQPEDSATYLCAVGDGNRKLTFGIGTVVRIKPNIKDPQPALYQLTSPKSSDTSVCLLTDFDSSNTYTNGNDSTVLEMMTMESKSYGAVAWGSKSSFNCTNAFPQNIINLTQPSGSTCKVQDVEQSFETDKDLNLMNASLIFLRVIFLKTVGFNLLMTLRLWSN